MRIFGVILAPEDQFSAPCQGENAREWLFFCVLARSSATLIDGHQYGLFRRESLPYPRKGQRQVKQAEEGEQNAGDGQGDGTFGVHGDPPFDESADSGAGPGLQTAATRGLSNHRVSTTLVQNVTLKKSLTRLA